MENDMIIQKLVEYIETNENNNEKLIHAISDIFASKGPKEEIDKLKAAYALNMCTISISQIVDYNDINILEQEYDVILNNLNLQQMPKDEALLQILKQMLDTITYFRMEAVEREFIEKEYQQKMKNAIWSAVPNFGVIIASGNPLTAAVSLASQVGIGYMNYRRNKAESNNEKEKQLWQLRKTAIEQFNGLRRELFDTAWRLADKYEFPDEYRLTEKQISQYNTILMDEDEIRKYERLYSIRDKFEAYPPFWYFIANTAKRISESEELQLAEKTREEYARKAATYFDVFFEKNKCNILREDQIAAAGCLEYVEILLKAPDPDKQRITECIARAKALCGNANDVLQLCAVLYLRNGDTVQASEILRILVNEEYNTIINAQLLSSIYVGWRREADYELLCRKVDRNYLYPMTGNDGEFKQRLRATFLKKLAICLEEFLNKYAIEWNKIIPVFEDGSYPDPFFADTPEVIENRLNVAAKVFADKDKAEAYKERLKSCDYITRVLDLVNDAYNKLFSSALFNRADFRSEAEKSILAALTNHAKVYSELSEHLEHEKFDKNDYETSQRKDLSIVAIFADTIRRLKEDYLRISEKEINRISEYEGMLSAFCSKNGLQFPEDVNQTVFVAAYGENSNVFPLSIFGEKVINDRKEKILVNEIIECIKYNVNDCGEAVFFTSDSEHFKEYFDNKALQKKSRKAYDSLRGYSVAIYIGKNFDLLLTTKGIAIVEKKVVQGLLPYQKVIFENGDGFSFDGQSYRIRPSVAPVFIKTVNAIKRIIEKRIPSEETDKSMNDLIFEVQESLATIRKALNPSTDVLLQ